MKKFKNKRVSNLVSTRNHGLIINPDGDRRINILIHLWALRSIGISRLDNTRGMFRANAHQRSHRRPDHGIKRLQLNDFPKDLVIHPQRISHHGNLNKCAEDQEIRFMRPQSLQLANGIRGETLAIVEIEGARGGEEEVAGGVFGGEEVEGGRGGGEVGGAVGLAGFTEFDGRTVSGRRGSDEEDEEEEENMMMKLKMKKMEMKKRI